jgi:hypothetical protein
MKGVGKIEYEKYILPIGIVVGGYLLLKHFDLFGDSANTANNSSITDSTAAGVDNSIKAAAAAGDFATLTDSQAAGIANAIFQAGLAHDASTVKYQIIQANTLTDLLKIIKAFGTKQAAESNFSACSMFGLGCQAYNLSAWLHTPFMDSDTLRQINGYFSSMNINYQF